VNKMNNYEKLQTARFLWSIYKNVRSQIKESDINKDKYYEVFISGIHLIMIKKKAQKYFNETKILQEQLKR